MSCGGGLTEGYEPPGACGGGRLWGAARSCAHLTLDAREAPPLKHLAADHQHHGGGEREARHRVDGVHPQAHPVAEAAQAGPTTLQAVWLAPPGLQVQSHLVPQGPRPGLGGSRHSQQEQQEQEAWCTQHGCSKSHGTRVPGNRKTPLPQWQFWQGPWVPVGPWPFRKDSLARKCSGAWWWVQFQAWEGGMAGSGPETKGPSPFSCPPPHLTPTP